MKDAADKAAKEVKGAAAEVRTAQRSRMGQCWETRKRERESVHAIESLKPMAPRTHGSRS